MGTFVIKGRPTWLGSLDISQIAHIAAIDYQAEALDNTVLSDTTRSNAGGLKVVGFSCDAYADFTTYDATLFGTVGDALPVSFASVDGTAYEDAYLFNARHLQYNPITGTVGDMAGVNITGGAAGKIAKGVIEFNASASSSSTSAGSQLGALSATQSLFANLHVTAQAGTSLDVIVQSDDNGSFTSATNRITFTQATGVTNEHLSVAGAITDDYWRLSYTIVGGSFTFAAAIGIA